MRVTKGTVEKKKKISNFKFNRHRRGKKENERKERKRRREENGG